MGIRHTSNGPSGDSVLALCPMEGSARGGEWIPLRFVGPPDQPSVLAPSTGLPNWARKLAGQPGVRWRADGKEFCGFARRIPDDDPACESILGRFEERFGTESMSRWFQGRPVCYEFGLGVRGPLHAPGSAEGFFDAAAPEYDRVVAANPIDNWLREESVAFLRATFRSGQRLLELGCGTGLETIPLAQTGIEVVATDVSTEMLHRLEDKATRLGLSDRIRTRKLPASDLPALLSEFGPASFDGAFSDFGALNLDPVRPEMVDALSQLVRPGGRLVFGVWNRVCAAEILLYSIGFRPSRALSRTHTPVPSGLSRFGLPVTAYAPVPFVASFEPAFELESLQALPVLVPPYDFLPHVPAPERLLPLLESADRAVRGRFPFNRLGDHFLVRLRRTGG